MSYDLYIYPDNFQPRATLEWLGWREHCETDGNQANYANDDTGVYFSFEVVETPEQVEGEDPQRAHVRFNLNYYRPHTFGLEAEIELSAFLKQFDSRIEDPQAKGMGEGPYTPEGFLSGWNHGNRFAFEAIGSQMDEVPPPWPADPSVIEAAWKWNYGREALQKAAGKDIFVPRISWFLPVGADAPVPACTWTDRVPTLIPESLVTHIALVRKPRQKLTAILGLSRSAGQPKFELKLAGVKGIGHMVGMDRREAHGQPVFHTPLVQTTEMNKLFSGDWPADAARIVPSEHVCGADLVALVKKKT